MYINLQDVVTEPGQFAGNDGAAAASAAFTTVTAAGDGGASTGDDGASTLAKRQRLDEDAISSVAYKVPKGGNQRCF